MDWQYRLHLCCSLPTPACLPISALVSEVQTVRTQAVLRNNSDAAVPTI